MTSKLLIQIVTAIVVSVFAVGILLSGGSLDSAWLRFYSVAVLAAMGALFLWDRFMWHWPLFQRIKAVPRDVRGTWRGSLESFWVDPDTNARPPMKSAYLVVRQTASHVSVSLLTDESRSSSTFARITDDGTVATLDYMYLNRPDSRVEHRSRMHLGSASFDVIGRRPVTRLKGRYWTSRDSKGELEFQERRSTAVEGFSEAEALFPPAEGALSTSSDAEKVGRKKTGQLGDST